MTGHPLMSQDKAVIRQQIDNGTYLDRKDVKDAANKERMQRNANGGWSTPK